MKKKRKPSARSFAASAPPLPSKTTLATRPGSAGAPTPERRNAPPDDEDEATATRDARDPADYHWVPVLRRSRADGWTPDKQRRFIEMLADTGSITDAAESVGMSVVSCYRLRRAPDAAAFAAAWDSAIAEASRRLVDIAFDRVTRGIEEPLYNRDGRLIGCRTRYNDRLLMFLLRAHAPDRYGHAHPDAPASPPSPLDLSPPIASTPTPMPALSPPIAQAIATLDPAVPPDPHLLMPPGDLDYMLEVADVLEGVMPPWLDDTPPEGSPPDTLVARLDAGPKSRMRGIEGGSPAPGGR